MGNIVRIVDLVGVTIVHGAGAGLHHHFAAGHIDDALADDKRGSRLDAIYFNVADLDNGITHSCSHNLP